MPLSSSVARVEAYLSHSDRQVHPAQELDQPRARRNDMRLGGALAWLGGTRRVANPTARIGFHAAHTTKGGQVTETGMGNAMIGAYLNELGLSEEAIVYITSADPRSMHWLTADDAATFGIELETLPTRNAQPPSSAASPPKLEESFEQRTANYPQARIAPRHACAAWVWPRVI